MTWAAKGRLCAVLAVLALGQHSVLPTRPREEMVPLASPLLCVFRVALPRCPPLSVLYTRLVVVDCVNELFHGPLPDAPPKEALGIKAPIKTKAVSKSLPQQG
ncbi:hypothetical protein O3P69_012374 [Scylla paramamosain]|uniref:Secreted protein n=1 Tax=Scylla paramamosain TaxID=85552 RepID=A0AAW0SET3_SCYPA